MSQSIVLTGMVLSSMPAGEYDRRITILTRERGKIAGFARGARRPKSSLVGAATPFCYGEFRAYEGRSSYTIVGASVSNYFEEVRSDLEKSAYGMYFLEVADHFSMENADGSDQLKLLYQSLRALSVKSLRYRLVRCIYEMKTLVFYGVYPDFFRCMDCGKKEDLQIFSPSKRGMLCAGCAAGRKGTRLDAASLYALQFIVASPVERLYTFTVTEEVLEKLESVAADCMRLCTSKEFRSLEFLKGITG